MSTIPPLHTIKDSLSSFLSSDIDDKTKFHHWLKMLFGDVYGQVLCVNLYIDLKNGSLDKTSVIKILNNMAFTSGDARWAFYKYVEDHQDECLFNHLGGTQLLKDDQYLRIISITDMIDFYLRHPLKLPSLTYEAEQEVLERFFYAPEDRKEKLGIVKAVWKGKMTNVWVTSKKELDSEISKTTEFDIANILRDRLGLSTLHSGKLVCIIYPIDFDRAQVYMPTSLDASTGALYFLSIISEEMWGMTCCLTSLNIGLKERIHKAFDGGLTDEFEMKFLGEITNDAIPDLHHLLNEALNRAV